MKHSAPRGRLLRRLAGLSTATVVLSLLVAPTSSVAQAPASANVPPGVDEIASSDNLKQVAYLPKTAPFNTETSYNTDWAFQGKYAYGGNYDGFTVYDISQPRAPKVAVQVLCPGSQNDVSVHGKLLFLGTDSQRTNDSCTNAASSADPAAPGARWEGVKIFDISDPTAPKYIKSIRTDCGSHTQTLVPGKKGDNSVYIYVQSYGPNVTVQGCHPPHDKISVIKVPLKDPTTAHIVSTPILFPLGGYEGSPGKSATSGCHDITVYADKDLAAGACMGDGVLIDISDRKYPEVIATVRDTENFAFWHSATFNNDATKVVFTDELGGGGAATCTEAIGPNRGANAIYDITGKGDKRKLVFKSYYKIPRINTANENCVAHNGSLIPVEGKDIMVQAWYQGGISVWDFTDSTKPTELAYWERGPLSADRLVLGGSWSAYWYNGFIYSSDIQKGVDVLELKDPAIGDAKYNRTYRFNAQTQDSFLNW